MRFSLSNLLKNAAPPPRVVLLPDALFFVRVVPVTATTSEELVSQVELALETLTPFPLAQLYYGFYRPEGAAQALVYAAYRKRFTTEQLDAWSGADLILPSFVALLGGEIKPGLTLVVASAGITVVHWGDAAVPEKVLSQALSPDAPHEDYVQLREEMLRAAGESLKILDLPAPAAAPSGDDSEMVFTAGENFVSRLPAALVDQLDVRDKDELAVRRRQRTRDLVLWRTFLGCAAAIALCLVGEFALIGGQLWQKSRLTVVETRAPAVDSIQAAQNLNSRIGELLTKRLLPFEMITLARSCMPPTVQFLRANASSSINLYTLTVEAKTGTPTDVGAYQTALGALPSVSSVQVQDQRTREGISNFTFVITFKSDSLQPASAIAATP